MKGTSILAGELRRQRMGVVPKGLNTRPILARIKKSLFDILKARIEGSRFLDLFAGSGSVGFEALSRGAGKVVFVDSNPYCARWIEETVSKVSARNPGLLKLGEAKVYRRDLSQGLGWLEGEEFDLIFSGAPYKDEKNRPTPYVHFLLEALQKCAILAKDGWFIAQHSKRESFRTPPFWNFFREERYGDTVLSFFKHAQ